MKTKTKKIIQESKFYLLQNLAIYSCLSGLILMIITIRFKIHYEIGAIGFILLIVSIILFSIYDVFFEKYVKKRRKKYG